MLAAGKQKFRTTQLFSRTIMHLMRREPKCEYKFVLEPNSAFILGGGGGGGEDFNLYFDIALETDDGNPKLNYKITF